MGNVSIVRVSTFCVTDTIRCNPIPSPVSLRVFAWKYKEHSFPVNLQTHRGPKYGLRYRAQLLRHANPRCQARPSSSRQGSRMSAQVRRRPGRAVLGQVLAIHPQCVRLGGQPYDSRRALVRSCRSIRILSVADVCAGCFQIGSPSTRTGGGFTRGTSTYPWATCTVSASRCKRLTLSLRFVR